MKPRLAYRPGRSFLHALHPLVKAGWLFAVTIAVFVIGQPWPIAGLLLITVAAYPLNGMEIWRIPGTRVFLITALLLAGLQLTFNQEGAVLAAFGPLTITQTGLDAAVVIAGRFLLVILLSYLFVLTTDPNDLAYGLMQVGMPYRFGFMLITALRLVPIFEQEAQRVHQAQLVRGASYQIRGPRRLFALLRQFLLPMLSSALGKVDALAVSMEGRGFGKYETRTFYRARSFTRRDGLGLVALFAFVIASAIFAFIT